MWLLLLFKNAETQIQQEDKARQAGGIAHGIILVKF
jgi:hypothetical protein